MDVYNLTKEDFIDWLKSEDGWPTQDWDYCITSTGKFDDLLFRFANECSCHKRDFCLHCLYYMVGEYFTDLLAFQNTEISKAERYKNRILLLLEKSEIDLSPEILEWQNKTQDLLNNKIDFDPTVWFEYMFLSGDTKQEQQAFIIGHFTSSEEDTKVLHVFNKDNAQAFDVKVEFLDDISNRTSMNAAVTPYPKLAPQTGFDVIFHSFENYSGPPVKIRFVWNNKAGKESYHIQYLSL